jgi:uncharacterized protein YndB with AHSA1/START domain
LRVEAERYHATDLLRDTPKELAMDVTRDVILPVDRDAAWAAVTDLELWLAEDCDLELEPGAEGELTLPGGETRRTSVEDVEPGERLTFWWHAHDEPATRVELTLADAAEGTRVVVVESGYAGAPVCVALMGLRYAARPLAYA